MNKSKWDNREEQLDGVIKSVDGYEHDYECYDASGRRWLIRRTSENYWQAQLEPTERRHYFETIETSARSLEKISNKIKEFHMPGWNKPNSNF